MIADNLTYMSRMHRLDLAVPVKLINAEIIKKSLDL